MASSNPPYPELEDQRRMMNPYGSSQSNTSTTHATYVPTGPSYNVGHPGEAYASRPYNIAGLPQTPYYDAGLPETPYHAAWRPESPYNDLAYNDPRTSTGHPLDPRNRIAYPIDPTLVDDEFVGQATGFVEGPSTPVATSKKNSGRRATKDNGDSAPRTKTKGKGNTKGKGKEVDLDVPKESKKRKRESSTKAIKLSEEDIELFIKRQLGEIKPAPVILFQDGFVHLESDIHLTANDELEKQSSNIRIDVNDQDECALVYTSGAIKLGHGKLPAVDSVVVPHQLENIPVYKIVEEIATQSPHKSFYLLGPVFDDKGNDTGKIDLVRTWQKGRPKEAPKIAPKPPGANNEGTYAYRQGFFCYVDPSKNPKDGIPRAMESDRSLSPPFTTAESHNRSKANARPSSVANNPINAMPAASTAAPFQPQPNRMNFMPTFEGPIEEAGGQFPMPYDENVGIGESLDEFSPFDFEDGAAWLPGPSTATGGIAFGADYDILRWANTQGS